MEIDFTYIQANFEKIRDFGNIQDIYRLVENG